MDSQLLPPSPSVSATKMPGKQHDLRLQTSIFVLLLAIVLLISFIFFRNYWLERQRQKYVQAVFLTSGQVFFGHLQSWANGQYLLTEVHYVQVDQTQQSDKNTNTSQAPVTLVQLGGEAYGPQNQMYINRDEVLYVEDLKDSSQVVQIMRENAKAAKK
jgi:hypothetical protein